MSRKSIISLLLILTVASVFSLNSLAVAQSSGKAADDPARPVIAGEALPQAELTGTLVITGTVTVNGNVVQNGATITSGSIVATNGDSDAAIDLGPLGRINLRPSTEIKVSFTATSVDVELRRCGSMTQNVGKDITARVSVAKSEIMTVSSALGEVKVRGQQKMADRKSSPVEEVVILQDQSKTFDKVEEITSRGESAFSVNCGDSDRDAFIYAPYGWIALLGLSAGVALAVAGDDSTVVGPGPTQPATPVQP
jgi:type 1 fimbria pilin